MSKTDGYIPMQDAVRQYGRAYTTYLHHVQRGNIKGKKVGAHWFISPDSIEEYYSSEKKGIEWYEEVARALIPIIKDGVNVFVQRYKNYIELFLPNDNKPWNYKMARYKLKVRGFAYAKRRSNDDEICFRKEI
jgi:hypothetical protein